MNLAELNDHWREIGNPHAIGGVGDWGDSWRWFCPHCKGSGHTGMPLFVAMNDALVHKRKYCPTTMGLGLVP